MTLDKKNLEWKGRLRWLLLIWKESTELNTKPFFRSNNAKDAVHSYYRVYSRIRVQTEQIKPVEIFLVSRTHQYRIHSFIYLNIISGIYQAY